MREVKQIKYLGGHKEPFETSDGRLRLFEQGEILTIGTDPKKLGDGEISAEKAGKLIADSKAIQVEDVDQGEVKKPGGERVDAEGEKPSTELSDDDLEHNESGGEVVKDAVDNSDG